MELIIKSIALKKNNSLTIGPNGKAFIVAELSGNHLQSFSRAKRLIDAARQAGVDAIKFQTFKPENITLDCDNKYFKVKVNKAWKNQTLFSLYKKVYTPWEWQEKLKKYGENKGLVVFSSPFDESAVDFLEKIKTPVYKIASFEIVDFPLLVRVGKTKKPVIISKGMASFSEVNYAIKILKDNGCKQVAVLHCISSYPAKSEEMNLSMIPSIKRRLGVISGISDHSLSQNVPIAAVALGAKIIEKHLTLSRKDGGPDAAFSLEPNEFNSLVKAVRETELAIGSPNWRIGKGEKENIVFRKSLFAVENIKKGDKLDTKNVRSIRPGYGLPPKYFNQIMGKEAKSDIERGMPLSKGLIKNF